MINGKKVVVVMPAYNAQRTLALTCAHLQHNIEIFWGKSGPARNDFYDQWD